jgi:hypothetical protein
VNSDYKLIYREEQNVITITSMAYYSGGIGIVITLGIIAYLFYDIFVLKTSQKDLYNDLSHFTLGPLSKVNIFDLLCVIMLGTIVLVKYSKIIPLRIYHNSKKKLYKVVFVNNILKKGKLVTFAEGTAVPVFKSKKIGNILFYVNNHMILLDEESFPVPYQREQMICKTI